MELQQNLNLITRILKQTAGLQHICREDFIANIKGKQNSHFSDFSRYDNIVLNQRHEVAHATSFLSDRHFFMKSN